jgi:hypothetical protein
MTNRISIFFAVTGMVVCLFASRASAQTAEVCGNGVDDDGDGFADEGCYPGLTNPLVDSPLSTADTGLISPSKGALYYPMPADIAAKTPYGPPLALRRTYVSMNNPGATPPPSRKPMGDRWIHNFMSWIDDFGSTLVIHLPTGQEITATLLSTCVYQARGGQAVKSVSHCSGGSTTVTMLDGSTEAPRPVAAPPPRSACPASPPFRAATTRFAPREADVSATSPSPSRVTPLRSTAGRGAASGSGTTSA